MNRKIRWKQDYSSLESYRVASTPDPIRPNTYNDDTTFVPIKYAKGDVTTVEVLDERGGIFIDVHTEQKISLPLGSSPDDYIQYID